jgi:O-antigen ligase
MAYYASFPTPVWQLGLIAAALVFVVFYTRVYGALAFFLAAAYSSLIIKVGPLTLVPVALGALLVTVLLHLKQPDAFRLPVFARPIVATWALLMVWILVRGSLALEEAHENLQTLWYSVVIFNLLPFLLAGALSWADESVRHFAAGFVAAVVIQMAVVWSRAIDAGLGLSSFLSDFWLTRWSGSEASPFTITTGVTNYHWYSWNLGLAALAVFFVLRKRESQYPRLYLAGACVFLVACTQQMGLVGSRQSIISLLVAVLYISWTRVRKAVVNVGGFLLVAVLALVALRALTNLEPLPFAVMRGTDTITEAFDPAVSRGSEWQKGLDAFVDSPWIGVGFSSEESFSLGHNIGINTLANLGLVGFVLLVMLVALYTTGPLRTVLRQVGSGLDINRGLLGMQLFLLGTSLASGSVIASSGMFWLGAMIVRRSAPPLVRKLATLRSRTAPVPA